MEIQGIIKWIDETKTYGNNGFQKRETVVTTEDNYPQHILVEFVQDKVGLLDAYSVGQKVKIAIDIKGREWTNPQGQVKYFNSIQGWKIEALDGTASSNAAPPVPPIDTYEPMANDGGEEEDDLPF